MSPMKIVVAFSDSEDARAAMACAAEIAQHAHGEIHLAYAVPAPAIPSFSSPHVVDQLIAEATAAAQKSVDAAAAELRAKGMAVQTHVRRWLVPDTVMDRANEVGASLIVMGRRGSSRATQLLIGTMSSEVVRLSRTSVLVVKKGDVMRGGAVLVAVDGSPHSIRAIAVARETFPDMPLVACAVERGDEHDPAGMLGKAIAAAGIDPKGVDPRVLNGDAATELLLELARPKYRAIVLGPRGFGQLKGLLLGSVSEKVLQLAHKPVLIAR